MLVLVLCCLFLSVKSQLEILGITSYNECFNIVPNANAQPPPDNLYLNCSNPNSGGQIPVTSLDLRLTVSGTSNSVFNLNLTVVPSQGELRANKNGLECSADPTHLEDCVMTTPAQLRITSTKYVYVYTLRRVSAIVPQYCYVAKFDAKSTSSVDITLANKQNMNIAGTVTCMQNDNVEYCSDQSGTSCLPILSFFDNPVGISTNNFTNITHQPAEYKYANQFGTTEGKYPKQLGTCRDTFLSYDSIRKNNKPGKLYNLPPPAVPVFTQITHDDYPTVSSFPISDPPPLALSTKVNTLYGDVLQYTFCGGYNCGGVYDAVCYNQFYNDSLPSAEITAFNAINGASGEKSGNVGTIGMEVQLYSLGPACVLYQLDEVPGVLVTVNFSVATTTNNGTYLNGTNQYGYNTVQNFTLTNLMGMASPHSDQAVAGARIISVDTLDGYIGPALAGYIIMCGDPAVKEQQANADQDYTDPRVRAQKVKDGKIPINTQTAAEQEASGNDPESLGLRNYGFIDMRSYVVADQTPYDPSLNPWTIIREGFPNKTRLYPLGENLNYSPVPGKKVRNAMWYYVNITNESWLGKGCNQLGITDLFWNTNFQGGEPDLTTGIEQCYLTPFTCVPGYTNESYGGRSIPGCLASAAFAAAYNGTESTQWELNRDQLNYVLENSLPYYYDPVNPNYWPLIVSDVQYGLAFDPSLSPIPVPALSFELVVDFVGTFISYDSTVPNGAILLIECSNGTEGGENTGNITIQNRGTISGSYIAQIVCPDNVIQIDDSELIYPDVDSGENATAPFFYDAGISPSDFPVENPCVVQLLPGAGAAFAVLDTQTFSCIIAASNGSGPDGPVINVNGSNPNLFGCTCFDFQCWASEQDSSIADSACFWLILIPLVSAIIAFTFSAIYFIHTARETKEFTKKYDTDAEEQFIAFKQKQLLTNQALGQRQIS